MRLVNDAHLTLVLASCRVAYNGPIKAPTWSPTKPIRVAALGCLESNVFFSFIQTIGERERNHNQIMSPAQLLYVPTRWSRPLEAIRDVFVKARIAKPSNKRHFFQLPRSRKL